MDLASRLHWDEGPFPTSLREFRKKIWREVIRNDADAADGLPKRREQVFLDIAWHRAIALRPHVKPQVNDAAALDALSLDSLVTASPNSSAVYTVTHDVLEDWAVLQGIEDRFAESDGSLPTLAKTLGGQPAIRRGFRQWLAERFEVEPEQAHDLVLSATREEKLEPWFKDDCLAAALLSDSAPRLVKACAAPIKQGDLKLLDRVVHILRVACKESPKWLGRPGLPTLTLVPKGPGWAVSLGLVVDMLDKLMPERRLSVLHLVEDWAKQVNSQNPRPPGVAEAGALLDRLLLEFEGYGFENERKRTLKIVAKIPRAVPQFENLMRRARTCRPDDETAFGLLAVVATAFEASSVCRDYPDEVIALLNQRLRLSEDDRQSDRSLGSSLDLNTRFGIRGLPGLSHSPPSALQGPFGPLLRYHPEKAVEFMLGLLNHSGRAYISEERSESLEPAPCTSLALPDGETVKQWANEWLYGVYRGNEMGATGPASIASLLMALESWLLELGKAEQADLEGWLLHVLRSSNNVMATGVVASVCVAYPDKAGKAGLALLSSRRIVELDRSRLVGEPTATGTPFFGPEPNHLLFEQERLASSKCPTGNRIWSTWR